jgi:hypothetical protein
MKFVNIKKIAAMSVLGLVAVLGMSADASAQYTRDDRESVYQQQQRAAAEIAREQRERQAELNRRNGQYGNNGDGYNGMGRNNRYRVNRNGRYYNTNQRGAELLRQAVNAGYQQGFRAGQNDRNSRRRSSWNNNRVYRSGTYGYQTHVDRSQYQYYFQQGFQKGYQDGYNSRNQFGTNNGGNILSSILGQILNIQTY